MKNFPVGLSILVVDHDLQSLQEVVTNLQKCDCQYTGLFWLKAILSLIYIYIYIYFAALHEMGIKGASFSLSFFFSSLYFLKVVSTIFSKEFSQMFFFFPSFGSGGVGVFRCYA